MNGDDLPAGPERRWFRRLAEGVFEIQRCERCGAHVFYPRVLCPQCGSTDLSWVCPSGRGTVYSTTVVRKKAEDGGDYNVCLIDLDEGPRMMGRVTNVAPDAVRIGASVRCRIDAAGDVPRVVWEQVRD